MRKAMGLKDTCTVEISEAATVYVMPWATTSTDTSDPTTTIATTMFLMTPEELMVKGLALIGIKSKWNRKMTRRIEQFKTHFGSSPTVYAAIWFDLCESKLAEHEKSENGFKSFMVAIYFLWIYPRNLETGAAPFKGTEKLMQGRNLWAWIEKIQSLKNDVIKFPESSFDPRAEIFIGTVDCTDCKIREVNHPLYPVDRKYYSYKHGKSGARCEVAISIFHNQVVWINGPFPGGKSEITIFRDEGLKDMIPHGKLLVADRGMRGEPKIISAPDLEKPKTLRNFEARARCRQETFNGRIKNFRCLRDVFEHGWDRHKIVFEAVSVIVQHQMNNGAPLYGV